MPRKIISHPFQFELLRQQKDNARIERELKLRQNLNIAEKQLAAQQPETSDDSELDSDSSLDVDPTNETSFPHTNENFSKPFDNRKFILGIIIGTFIGLCLGLVFQNPYTHLTTLIRNPLYR